MDLADYIDITLETPYNEGLEKVFFPVLIHTSGKKYVYHKERDEETNEVTEGFCVCDNWHDMPIPVNVSQQKALDFYFLNRYRKALKYAKSMKWESVKLVSIFPVMTYELLPHSINTLEDGRKVTGMVELWDDGNPVLVIGEVDEQNNLINYGKHSYENYVISVINKRYVFAFIDLISKENKAYDFNIRIPIINSQFGEFEEVRDVHCSWKRIVKIASYYSQFGLTTISFSTGNLLLWASYMHKRLPIPFTRYDVDVARKEWNQMTYDNPFLENSIFDGSGLTKWDFEIIEKARLRMNNR